MKSKILNLLLILASLIGYLEWGGNSHSFLFQIEGELFSKLFTDPISTLHPFTILPLIGQIALMVTLFQKIPSKSLTNLGIGSLGVLLVFMFLIGILSLNTKIVLSTIPFIALSMIALINNKKLK